MKDIRRARKDDGIRIAEIFVFNYRLNFYPIFKDDDFYFKTLNVSDMTEAFEKETENIWVFDDGAVKGFIEISNNEIKRLFVEPVLQGRGIGQRLLEFAVKEKKVDRLWALEKNTRAIACYMRHGFILTEDKKHEEDTEEYLVRMVRRQGSDEWCI